MRQFETDDGVFDEFFAEGFPLVGVFEGFFVADAGEARGLDYYAYAGGVSVLLLVLL